MNIQEIKNRFDIIGNSEELNHALNTAVKVSATDLTVLISGESGTGKEVFSKIIHQLSKRKHQPFIAINCGAIPEGTIDSELFGHEKGSFTGATEKRKGYFEAVDNGTIFLDEIAEMPMGTQARLLRLLQNGEYIKVGSSIIQKCNVRVIAATNKNLIDSVQKNKFREDLYYRLNSIQIEIPALRDRGFDIDLLFRKFSNDFVEKNNLPTRKLTENAKKMLLDYRWPGNIRQLKNIAEQINLLADSIDIDTDLLAKFIPNFKTTLDIYQPKNDFSENQNTNTDISLKLLLELKQDISDIKRALFEMSKEKYNNQNRDHYYDNDFNSNAIPLNINTDKFENKIIDISNSKKNFDSPIIENLNIIELEKKLIIEALKRNKGKRKYAAIDLGISERTLYRKIINYDLE